MTAPEEWVSPETEQKERHYRGLVRIHARICKAILAKQRRPLPYLFADLHGGPGNLPRPNGAGTFLGSPLITLDELVGAQLPYQTWHFEHDIIVADRLAQAIPGHDQLGRAQVWSEPFEQGVPRLLERLGRQPWRYGLIYSDPISDPIPVDALNLIAKQLLRVDLLAYVSATNQYKRANANGQGHGRRLADDILAVDKAQVLIRKPHRAEQYTFILWSNWVSYPDWKKEGFYKLDSPQGREILEVLDCTKKELHARRNTPLPGLEPPPPYATYEEYLRHPRFLAVKAQVFERAGGICERCGLQPATDPHHLVYPPWGTFDVPENLVAVCHDCHCRAHGKER
jgi:hypothetical protein